MSLVRHYSHPVNPVHVCESKPCASKDIAVHLAMAMGPQVRPCSDITTAALWPRPSDLTAACFRAGGRAGSAATAPGLPQAPAVCMLCGKRPAAG